MLDMNAEEREILADALDVLLADLRMEIGRTDRQDFREMLKKRKRVLEKTVDHLRRKGERLEAVEGQGEFHL